MNRKIVLRCCLISLLLAAPAPLLIALFVHFAGGPLSFDTLAELDVDGVGRAYFAVALAVLILLLIACLTLQALMPQRAILVDVEDDDREIGEVKWFNVNKGYGFITRASGEDVFVHFRAIRGRGHRTLAEGQKVRYQVSRNDRGLQADDVTVIT